MRYLFIAMFMLFVLTAATPVDSQTDASGLTLTSAPTAVSPADLLSFDRGNWQTASSEIHWNRTPPLYSTDPRDDGNRPAASVQVLRVADTTLFRLVWEDDHADIAADPVRIADAGEPSIYKRQTAQTDVFPDAMCVMVPQQLTPDAPWPSLIMGDGETPVWLYYWRNGRGFTRLQAAGRETTQETPGEVRGDARRTQRGWDVVVAVPNLSPGTPVAFAIWDGERGDRDGSKYYSLWYRLQ